MTGTGDGYVYGTSTAGVWVCDVCGRSCPVERVTMYLHGGMQLCPLCHEREMALRGAK